MTITLIVINYNSGKLLAKCFKHLSKQTVVPDQILIIDNASSDHSSDGPWPIDNVTVHKMEHNSGFSAANNYAFEICDTDYVALLNPDAFPEPDWLEKLMDAAERYPDVVAFGSRQLIHGKHGILDGVGDAYHISGLVWRDRYLQRQTEADLNQKEIFSPCAAAALYRRQALVDVGGFDEDFFCYVEDVDLGFRLRLSGYKALYVPDAVVNHVGSATTGGPQSDFSIYYGHRNLVWTYIKDMPGLLFWVLLPYHLLMNLFAIGWFVLHGRVRVIFSAKKDAIKGIPKMWHKRHVVQSNRAVSSSAIWSAMDRRIIPWGSSKN